MRITQGQFSFLPDLTDEEIRLQVDLWFELRGNGDPKQLTFHKVW
jgi:hypothetical protein